MGGKGFSPPIGCARCLSAHHRPSRNAQIFLLVDGHVTPSQPPTGSIAGHAPRPHPCVPCAKEKQPLNGPRGGASEGVRNGPAIGGSRMFKLVWDALIGSDRPRQAGLPPRARAGYCLAAPEAAPARTRDRSSGGGGGTMVRAGGGGRGRSGFPGGAGGLWDRYRSRWGAGTGRGGLTGASGRGPGGDRGGGGRGAASRGRQRPPLCSERRRPGGGSGAGGSGPSSVTTRDLGHVSLLARPGGFPGVSGGRAAWKRA